MADLSSIKTEINTDIVTNGTGDITADVLNNVLIDMCDEVENALTTTETTTQNTMDDVSEQISEVGNKTSIIVKDMFELGNITITANGWTYGNSYKRVRLKQGTSIHLYKGDVISLTDYTDARFFLGWLNNGSYSVKGWNTSDYTLTSDGDYVILISNITEVNQSDASALFSLLRISSIKLNDNLAAKAIENTRDLDVLENSIYNEKFFSANTASMLGEEYFKSGSLQNNGTGAPQSNSNCAYTTPIPYKNGTITITATDAAKALITGIRVQVRNDCDFSTTDYKMIYSGYSWINSIELPREYTHVSFGFAATNSEDWTYAKMSGITITTTEDWDGVVGNLADRLGDVESDVSDFEETILKVEYGGISSISDISLTDGYYLSVNSGQPISVQNQSAISDYIAILKGDTLTFTLSQSSTAGLVCVYDEDKNFVSALAAGQGWGTYVSGSYTATDDVGYIRISCVDVSSYLPNYTLTLDRARGTRFDALEDALKESTSIIGRNNKAETTNILQQWSATPKQGRTSTYASVAPLVLLHFSDVHADEGAVERIIEYNGQYTSYITDVIHTGDAQFNSWSDGFTLWDIDGASGFLNTIGNHDTAEESGGVYDWDAHVGLDAYNRFFAPYISGWGVTQPTDAATYGYCYYYKDYTSCGIRLVVLDDMGWDATQLSWFTSVLSSAITDGLSVVVAKHYPVNANTYIAPEWTSLIDQRAGSIGGSGNDSDITSAVDTFKTNGGDFICWLNGHTHRDMFTMVGTDKDQLCVNIASATTLQSWWDECLKVTNTKSEDLFNMISFDSYLKIVKVMRVGCDYNYYGQHRGTITIDYTNGNILSEV